MTNSLQTALHFPVAHHPRTIWKSSLERDLLTSPAGLLVVRVTECEERPVVTDHVRNWPMSICLPGSGVWLPSFYLRNTLSGRLPPHMQHLIPLFGDLTTCCLPPWASIFWTTSLLADSSFHRLLCMMAPLIHMIICCTLTKQ